MIFQIDYKSEGKYDKYFDANRNYIDFIDYKLYADSDISYFLGKYGWEDEFYNAKVHPTYEYAHNAILCDLLRLMILYEFGGIYVDADVRFRNDIITLEAELQRKFGHRALVVINKSLFFLRASKHSPYIRQLLDVYVKTSELTLDIFMNKRHQISKFSDEMSIVSHDYLNTYFTHEQVTTNEKYKLSIRV